MLLCLGLGAVWVRGLVERAGSGLAWALLGLLLGCCLALFGCHPAATRLPPGPARFLQTTIIYNQTQGTII
ncbi:MAG: hypothetical protein LBH56_03880 [Coriobacteriales bacterium]|nr:hypothetical protein [Coriobacteriales bacterium]